MNEKIFHRAMSYVDDDIVENFLDNKSKRQASIHAHAFLKWGAVAAVFCIAVATSFVMLLNFPNSSTTPTVPVTASSTTAPSDSVTPESTVTPSSTEPAFPELIIPETYQALHLPGAMSGFNSSTGTYSGLLSQGAKRYKKTNITSRYFDFFGTREEYIYTETMKTAIYPYDVDTFEGSSVLIEINSQTGQVVGYDNYNKLYRENFKPIFDHTATLDDYLAYAKTILAQLVDVDWKDYQVESKRYDDGGYSFRFSKTISGIPCRGYYTIGIEASGMVDDFDLFINEEGFAPFENLVIDKAKLDQIVMANYKLDTASLNVFSHESPEHDLYVENGVLWAQSVIKFRYEGKADSEGYKPEMAGSFCYMIKLAEVKQ